MSRVLGEVAGRVGEQVQVERGPLGPVRFWRGQSRYEGGGLLDSWIETVPWWQRDAAVAGGASARVGAARGGWGGGGGGGGRPRVGFSRGGGPCRWRSCGRAARG